MGPWEPWGAIPWGHPTRDKGSGVNKTTPGPLSRTLLDREWSGNGPELPQGTSRKLDTEPITQNRNNQKPSLTPPSPL